MLETLYKKGYLDCTKIILENAKPLGLNAEESFVLIKILENYRETKKLSIEQLQENILITSNTFDNGNDNPEYEDYGYLIYTSDINSLISNINNYLNYAV